MTKIERFYVIAIPILLGKEISYIVKRLTRTIRYYKLQLSKKLTKKREPIKRNA